MYILKASEHDNALKSKKELRRRGRGVEPTI